MVSWEACASSAVACRPRRCGSAAATGSRLRRGPRAPVLTRIVRRGEDRLVVEIRGHELERADQLGRRVVSILEEVPGVTFAKPDREVGQLERVLHVDRARAAETVVDPIPSALVLTAIVIGLGVTALMLSYAIQICKKNGSLSIDDCSELKG